MPGTQQLAQTPVRKAGFRSGSAAARGLLVYALPVWAALLGAAGCANRQPYVTDERLQRGLVIVLPGIEGRSTLNEQVCRGLSDGGVDWAIELYDWTSPLGMLYNLRAYERNRRAATEIGWHIADYHWKYPDRPVVLVGQSGGGAMAVWTAEQLLPGQKVDGVILLAASLSPKYILDFALANSTRGMVNFYSSRDWVILGLGTIVAETMDGRHSVSAGEVGFDVPRSKLSLPPYDKLYQVSWRPDMAMAGNPGMHLTSGAPEFVATYVAPLITGRGGERTWSTEFIEKIVGRYSLESFLPELPARGGPISAPARAGAQPPAGNGESGKEAPGAADKAPPAGR
jgi:pimeloyl-ACP methyl ester carboxylesterase